MPSTKRFPVQKTARNVSEDGILVPSSLPPGRVQKRLALAVLISLFVGCFIVAGPLASIHPGRMDAFVPAYATAMFVNDTITAILLFAQFSIVRSKAILLIADGYVFTALILIPWILMFPGVFVLPGGLIGGLQSTSWLYFLLARRLSLIRDRVCIAKGCGTPTSDLDRPAECGDCHQRALTAAIVLTVTFAVIAGEAHLPRVVTDSLHLSSLWPYVGAPVALLSILALIVLWIRRRSMLDLWLMVVMCLYAIEIPLSYYPAPVRFSLGWYTVRVIGFLSSSLVLIVLLSRDNDTLCAGARSGTCPASRARGATDDRRCGRGHDCSRSQTAFVWHDNERRCGLALSQSLDARSGGSKGGIQADYRRWPSRGRAVIEVSERSSRRKTGRESSLDLNDLIKETMHSWARDLNKHRILVEQSWMNACHR